jgi:hypothetical protein
MCHFRVYVYVACLLVLCKGCFSCDVIIGVVKGSVSCKVIDCLVFKGSASREGIASCGSDRMSYVFALYLKALLW